MREPPRPHRASPTRKSREIDAEIEELTEDEATTEQERIKRKWATIEALVGSKCGLLMVAGDLVQHFEDRVAAMDGKAMVVCMSRRICVALYNQIIALQPDWHSDDDAAGTHQGCYDGLRRRSRGVAAARWDQVAPRFSGKACEGPKGCAQARDRAGHVADRLRCAVNAHDVYRQADEGPRADAGDRPREPRVPR